MNKIALIGIFFVTHFLVMGSAFAGESKRAPSSSVFCQKEEPKCPGGGTAIQGEDGCWVCHQLPSLPLVTISCFHSKPVACPGGGAILRCPGNHDMWMCHTLPRSHIDQ